MYVCIADIILCKFCRLCQSKYYTTTEAARPDHYGSFKQHLHMSSDVIYSWNTKRKQFHG